MRKNNSINQIGNETVKVFILTIERLATHSEQIEVHEMKVLHMKDQELKSKSNFLG